MILAAGKGSRLAPLTALRPKALCPVDNEPLIDLAIERARTLTPAVAVNVHHGREMMEAHLAGRVHLSIETELLGTAGALGNLRGWIDGRDVLVLNADSWHRAGPDILIEGWEGKRIRLLSVVEPGPADFGRHRYTGACLLPWKVVSRLRPERAGLYEICWRPAWEQGDLELIETPGPSIDCGTPSGYLSANLAASGGQSVIGPGSVVQGEVIRSVVWPGGRVGPHERLVEAIRAGSHLTVYAPLSLAGQG